MFINKLVRGASLVLAGGLTAVAAHAAAVHVATGVDDGGTVLAAGETDTHWLVSVNGVLNFHSTQVNFPSQICCKMETVSPTAAWVTDSGQDGQTDTGWGIDNVVTLRTSFNLTGFDLSTTTLSGTWRVADDLLGIYLNGNEIEPALLATWLADQTLSVNSASGLFHSGVNTLEVRATSRNSTWDGLWMDATISDGHTVPEPGSLALLALAGLAAGVARRRRT